MAKNAGEETTLKVLLQKLGLERFTTSKLTLRELLNIGSKIYKATKLQPFENIPWYFLQKLLGLIGSARNLHLEETETSEDSHEFSVDDLFENTEVVSNSVNPLDIVCALLHCSDKLLQQEIIRKMSMCQFAVPLILPAGDGSDECTFMLWAMRDIVKTWRPKKTEDSRRCIEKGIAHIPLPIYSFVRLQDYSSSKSHILNQILSPEEQLHDFFIHKNLNGGNVPRRISNGLVELVWYFPTGSDSDVFDDPITVANLRGDLQSNTRQFNLLTKVSAMVFIFIENIEEDNEFFTDIDVSNEKYFFMVTLQASSNRNEKFNMFLENLAKVGIRNYFFIVSKDNVGRRHSEYLSTLFSDLKDHIMVQDPNMSQDRQTAKNLQILIKRHLLAVNIKVTLEDISYTACELGMSIDENCEECKNTKVLAREITQQIKDMEDYKKENLKLQGCIWNELSKLEKELCQLRKQGTMYGEEYKFQINRKIEDLRRQQNQQEVPDGMRKFLVAFTKQSQVELNYFLKWMKFYLDSMLSNNVSPLLSVEHKNMSQHVLQSNLGVEHFIRELGQFYEAECFLFRNREMKISHGQFQTLPGIAADLLLNGFPLELFDGDASNSPLQWITDVLIELDRKTGGKCRMRVISVLGIQSTGKSTLLNTMFGLQYPVSSGRCTRGAFMTFLKVEEDFQLELGCNFIVVIDTEGLKAAELAGLDDSSEHDNELATLVVGLSDITIINMSMENTSEMRDILQIVVHAFLRMKHIGKKPNCQFVHQNVSDMCADEKIMRDKKVLLQQLDEMTRVAAKMEDNADFTQFSDIIEYDIEKHNWYIPSLWRGVPPMASISPGYSELVFKFKMYLLNFIKQKTHSDSSTIKDFVEWIKSLWNAVKHEKFIFSFRSCLVADAYNQLCIFYSNMEWKFRKEAHNWMIRAENEIKNKVTEETEPEVPLELLDEMNQTLQKEEKIMIKSLEEYFDGKKNHVKLIEKYKEDFMRSISLLKNELESYLNEKCREVLHIQIGKYKIKAIKATFHDKIAQKAKTLLNNYREEEQKLCENELEREFEKLWNSTLQGLNVNGLKRQDIGKIMLEHLRKDMSNKAGYINEKLIKLNSLEKYQTRDFKIKPKHFEGTSFVFNKNILTDQFQSDAKDVAITIIDRCFSSVANIVSSKVDYNKIYGQKLLEIISKGLSEKEVHTFHFKQWFELDLKLLVFGKAYPMFQKMHEDFIHENDSKLCLEKLKPNYLILFKQVFIATSDCKIRAQEFCKICLKPALSEYVFSNLGMHIVDDILTSEDSIKYGSRTFFQTALLRDLLVEKKFDDYVKYCLHYERFLKDWITKYIISRYKESGSMKKLISILLSAVTKKIKEVLEQDSLLNQAELSQALKDFRKFLNDDLVISQDHINLVSFEIKEEVPQFFQYVKISLDDIASQVEAELECLNTKDLLTRLSVQPQEELFKKVFGCGKRCPFCKVPCEAGGSDHKKHFSSIHRPQGLGKYRNTETNVLCHELCSTDVVGNRDFKGAETKWKPHPYKEYYAVFPDWKIQPDPSIEAAVYWKYIFKEFNEAFAKEYDALPAELPEDWYNITKEDAFKSLERNKTAGPGNT
ncbi:up-regulator of cell proliferation-like [Hyperolius riggenbachi]|uniref:up-regulator of cell proliferation-like n=1 Tax=Hyperolius riggenbachi TaxID=752182 RepID=UPI0035A3CEA4